MHSFRNASELLVVVINVGVLVALLLPAEALRGEVWEIASCSKDI